jgi:hypothetical protein
MSFLRPVARTACRNSVSSQELTVVRSSGLSSFSSSANSGRVGPWPLATLTVECTTGTPKVLMVLVIAQALDLAVDQLEDVAAGRVHPLAGPARSA